jgi:hypothetical protein
MEPKNETTGGDAAVVHQEGIYLYAIIRHRGRVEFGRIGMGSKGELVYGIHYKDICAVVSRSSRMRYDARRLHLLTHEIVLEEVMKEFTILPIRFSTVSETFDESRIVNILRREYEMLSSLLRSIEGKSELSLKVIGMEGPVFKYIVDNYDDIRRGKEELAGLPAGQSRLQFVRIGEMVDHALKEVNEKYCDIITKALQPLAYKVKICDTYGERMVLNAAFLVEEKNRTAFDAAIKALDEQHGNLFVFKYVGPLPPYNYVNLVINV